MSCDSWPKHTTNMLQGYAVAGFFTLTQSELRIIKLDSLEFYIKRLFIIFAIVSPYHSSGFQ